MANQQTESLPKVRQDAPADSKTYVFDKVYTFRLRRHKGGSFNGLWELTMLDAKGKVAKMVSDADGLNYCMENVQGELEADGF